MRKNLLYYLSLAYPIRIERMEDGQYCAQVPLLKGCKGYGLTPEKALEELEGVKHTLLELMLKQGKQIPEPTVTLEIPLSQFSRFPNRRKLKQYIKF